MDSTVFEVYVYVRYKLINFYCFNNANSFMYFSTDAYFTILVEEGYSKALYWTFLLVDTTAKR